MAHPLICIHGLWKITYNDGHFLAGMESDSHSACGRRWVVSVHTEGADMIRPSRVFSVGYPTTASRMGEVGGKAGLRKFVRRRWCVDGMIVYFIFPIAQCVRKRSVVG